MQDFNISDLIECPFCESDKLTQVGDVDETDEWKIKGWFIQCECGARCGTEKNLADAKARWNRDFEYFIRQDGTPSLFTVKYIAFTDGYAGYTGEKQYEFEAETMEDARHWVINHLDCSCEWTVKEL